MEKNSVIASERRERGNPAQPHTVLHDWIASSHVVLLAMTLLVFLLPALAHATKLAVCDGKTYEVTINNDGQVHTVTISPASGSIEEFGPRVSMQIQGQKPVLITEPYDEYCIWSGKIKLQQIRSGDDTLSGGGGGR